MESVSLLYFALGLVFFLAAITAHPLVRLNLWFYRQFGLIRFADWWERRLAWWVPTVRAVCIVIAVAFVVVGLGIVGIG
jgi:hypothetical protein